MESFNTDIEEVKNRVTACELSVDLTEIEEIDENGYILSGIKAIDHSLEGVRMNELSVIFGKSSQGKTTFVNQMIVSFLNQDVNVFMMSGEISLKRSRKILLTQLAGKNNLQLEYKSDIGANKVNIKQEAIDKINKWAKGRLRIHKDYSDIDDIIKSMKYAIGVHNTKIFVLDNLMVMRTTESLRSKWEEQSRMMSMLNDFVKEHEVHIFLVAHAKKMANDAYLDQYSIMGSSEITNLAHNIISVERLDSSDKRYEDLKGKTGIYFNSLVTMHKVRDTGEKKINPLMFDRDTRLLYDAYTKEEINKKNNWELEEDIWN